MKIGHNIMIINNNNKLIMVSRIRDKLLFDNSNSIIKPLSHLVIDETISRRSICGSIGSQCIIIIIIINKLPCGPVARMYYAHRCHIIFTLTNKTISLVDLRRITLLSVSGHVSQTCNKIIVPVLW